MNTFLSQFRLLLQMSDKTQKEMCDDLGIPPQKISNWKTGYCSPNFDDLIMLADYFDVSLDYLLGREDDNGSFNVQNTSPALTSEEQHLLDTFRKLNMKNRMHVSTYADIRLEDQGVSSAGKLG